jgi:hypothetical protein
MPAHLLFVLPFFLFLVVQKINGLAFFALLGLYVYADYAYFTRDGFFVKPYATPYEEMANVVRHESRGQDAILVISAYGAFDLPLVNRLNGEIMVITLNNQHAAREVLEAARTDSTRQSVIWLWRKTTDISPGGFVTELEQDLSTVRSSRRHEFVPYSLPERWARRLLRGPGQPEYYYRLSEFR